LADCLLRPLAQQIQFELTHRSFQAINRQRRMLHSADVW
jgi:hypothetical protein